MKIKVWIIDLDAVRCQQIKKSICHVVKVYHVIILTSFGTEYTMPLITGHTHKTYCRHFVSSLEKGKLIFIYCLVHFQYLLILTMSFCDLAKFLLKL